MQIQVYDNGWITIAELDQTIEKAYHLVSLDLAAYALLGNVSLRWKGAPGTTGYFYFDNVQITGFPGTAVTIASDNFENGNSGGIGWKTPWQFSQYSVSDSTFQPYEGNKALQMQNQLGSIERSLDLSQNSKAQLEFYAKTKYYTNNSKMYVKIWYEGKWQTLATIDQSFNEQYHKVIIDLSSYQLSNDVRLKWEAENTSSGYFYLDDLKVISYP